MKMCDFECLPEAEQLEIIQHHGVYIGKRWANNFSMLLYQVDEFYVEVIYSKYRCYVSGLRCFRSTMLLEPYLEQINIEPLRLLTV